MKEMYGLIVCTLLTGPKSWSVLGGFYQPTYKPMEPALSVLTSCLSCESQCLFPVPMDLLAQVFHTQRLPEDVLVCLASLPLP